MNALRSMTRYVAVALPEFEVRFTGQEGAFERPFCAVVPATGAQSTPRGQHNAQVRQTFAITAYPALGLNVESSRVEAGRVERALMLAFARGVSTGDFSPMTNRAHPMRVPMYDYGTVPLYQPATPADLAGWMRVVEPPTFQTIGEAEFVVTANVRVQWVEDVSAPAGGPIAMAVHSDARDVA